MITNQYVDDTIFKNGRIKDVYIDLNQYFSGFSKPVVLKEDVISYIKKAHKTDASFLSPEAITSFVNFCNECLEIDSVFFSLDKNIKEQEDINKTILLIVNTAQKYNLQENLNFSLKTSEDMYGSDLTFGRIDVGFKFKCEREKSLKTLVEAFNNFIQDETQKEKKLKQIEEVKSQIETEQNTLVIKGLKLLLKDKEKKAADYELARSAVKCSLDFIEKNKDKEFSIDNYFS